VTVAPWAATSVPPPGRPPPPSLRSRLLSVAAVAGLGVLAFVVAVAGAFVHRWAIPAGLLLAITGPVGVAILARASARSRFGLAVIAMLWFVPISVIMLTPAGADRVILGDWVGLVFLLCGTAGLAIVLGFGVEARSTRRVT
jgi:hypothetical protein